MQTNTINSIRGALHSIRDLFGQDLQKLKIHCAILALRTNDYQEQSNSGRIVLERDAGSD